MRIGEICAPTKRSRKNKKKSGNWRVHTYFHECHLYRELVGENDNSTFPTIFFGFRPFPQCHYYRELVGKNEFRSFVILTYSQEYINWTFCSGFCDGANWSHRFLELFIPVGTMSGHCRDMSGHENRIALPILFNCDWRAPIFHVDSRVRM